MNWKQPGHHHEYRAREWEWTFAWISFLGGREYLFPPIPYSELDTGNAPAPGVSVSIDDTNKSLLGRPPRAAPAAVMARVRRAVCAKYPNMGECK